jgi:hypothetical protein
MLLCDFAEAVGGKLYIMGGGWSRILVPNSPTNMALAVKVEVPWDQANTQLNIEAVLVTEDGEPGLVGGKQIKAEGQAEVGRPPGIKRGSPIDLVFALNFGQIGLGPGGYRWELYVNQTLEAAASFHVQGGG